MNQRVTMTDVAREAGVSLMTVSRVVNNKEDVSSLTRERVLEIIDRLGYRPSNIARGLVTKRTSTLGVVVPDIANPFFSGVVHGVEQEAYAEDYSVFLCNTNEDPKREIAVLQSLEDRQVDGVILCSSRLNDEELEKAVERFPAAVLISRQSRNPATGVVLINEEAGGFMATEHLVKSGRKKIGLISGPAISFSSTGRTKGYLKALEAAGLSHDPDWIRRCSPVIDAGQVAALSLLHEHPELNALFCHNDLVAVGALHACAELDLRVPQDIAIVGYDDIILAAEVSPPLTTCRVSRSELGQQAVRLLLDQNGTSAKIASKVTLSPTLVVRGSAP